MVRSREATDQEIMARCVALSRIAVGKGEYPFAAIIALDDKIIVEAINRRFRENDLTRHAEIVALSRAQKTLSRREFLRATLYSNIEPCAMCSYCIREAWVGRVVYALASPIMGGSSKWNILCDNSMSGRLPQIFGPEPQIVSGVLAHEAELVWHDWNPFAWSMIKRLGLLKVPCSDPGNAGIHHGDGHSIWRALEIWLGRNGKSQVEGAALNVPNPDL